MNNLCGQLRLLALNGNGMNVPLERVFEGVDYDEVRARRRDGNVKRIFRGERPSSIPIQADLRWWFAEQGNDGTLAASLRHVDLGKVMATAWIGKGFKAPSGSALEIEGVHVHETWSGEPLVYANGGFPGSVHTVFIETAHGVLRAQEAYASRSFGIVEYPVKSVADLRVARHVYELWAEQAGSSGMPGGNSLAPAPIQNLLIHLAGVECGIMMLLDEREELEEFMACLMELERPLFEMASSRHGNMPEDACVRVFTCENLSSDISGSYWDAYLGPQLRRRAELCAKSGAVYGIHQDGKLSPLLARLREAGVSFVNGVTAAPAGDVEPEALRAMAGPEMVLFDIVPQTIFTDAFSDQAFESYVARVANCFKDDGKVVLGIGDMLPANGLIRRVETYYDIVESVSGRAS